MKNEQINIRVSTEEKNVILDRSKKAKMSLSEYMINASMNNEIVVVESVDKFSSELRRIGNNINQLTRLANSRVISCVELDGVKKELSRLWQLLSSSITK